MTSLSLASTFLKLKNCFRRFFFSMDTNNGGEENESTANVPFTQLGQVDMDFALAKTLQDQEMAIMMLDYRDSGYDGSGDEYDTAQSRFEDDWEDHFMEEYRVAQDPMELEDELCYEELIALSEVVGTESKGLAIDELSSLPSSTYKYQSACNGDLDRCAICQFDYEEGEDLVVLSCAHQYHGNCLKTWLQIKKVCPICGKEVSSKCLGKKLSPT